MKVGRGNYLPRYQFGKTAQREGLQQLFFITLKVSLRQTPTNDRCLTVLRYLISAAILYNVFIFTDVFTQNSKFRDEICFKVKQIGTDMR